MQKMFGRGWIVRTVAVMAMVTASGVAVPDHARPQDQSQDATPEAEIDPQAIAGFQTRDYKIRPKKLWKALLKELERRGYPPEEVDEEARIVKTSFVDFESKDFEGEVAEPPPTFGPNQHILTMKKIRLGKVSLEARIARSDAGSKLSIRARILVDGMDRRKMLRVLIDRRSNGIIEADFIERLEASLDIEPV